MSVLNKILFFCSLAILFSCSPKNPDYYEKIVCDAETISSSGSKFKSVDGSYRFWGGDLQNSEKAHSGKYSAKLTSFNEFAFEIRLSGLVPGDKYNIYVWRYGKTQTGKLVVSDINAEKLVLENVSPVLIDSSGWELLSITFTVPDELKDGEIKTFVWNSEKETVYFDDFTIIRYPINAFMFKEKSLEITISEENMNKLDTMRKYALKQGVLITNDSSWVDAVLKYGKKKYKASLRFKGDWLDHLFGTKWSFRIKLKGNKAWKGMKTFSIQSPESRDFLNEWVAHEIYKEQGLLSTRFEYVPVILNGKQMGVYVYEEHFEKQLIEHKQRREGPIVKFAEDLLWVITKIKLNDSIDYLKFPIFESSIIEAFKQSQIMSDENLRNEFMIAQNLMYQYKYHLKNTSDVFDVEALAKYYALTDLLKLYHGNLAWHNLRYYYNPVLSKLEPVLYDGYSGQKIDDWVANPIFGSLFLHNDLFKDNKLFMFLNFFADKKFVHYYIKYLRLYSSEDFLNDFFKKASKKLKENESLISEEYPYYSYDNSYIFKNAAGIRNELDSFEYKINNTEVIINSNALKNINYPSDSLPDNYEIATYLVRIFFNEKNEDNYTFGINNFYFKTIEVMGYGKDAAQCIYLPKPESVKRVDDLNYLQKITIKSKDVVNYFFVKINNQDSLFAIKIIPWHIPQNNTPEQELFAQNLFPEWAGITITDETVTFNSNNVTVNKPLIIPAGYKFVIKAGTNIDITSGAMIISYSPVTINGTEKNPVKIYSSDKSANGFTVLQADEKSVLNYVIFDNLNTLNYKGWTLTGSVTFYESDLVADNVSFINNHCEDDLNIIRSEFTISRALFENTYSDAFDLDFSNGTIINSTFRNLGNDAIDFSGSKATIENCNINGAKDKGISGGEKSTLTVKNVTVTNANIGIASKDKSKVTVETATIEKCNYGFVLLQKKPEYGDAVSVAKGIKFNEVNTKYLIEKGSALTLEGTEIKGTEKKLAKQFYQ